MKYNPKLKKDVTPFFEYVIIVEGKKDVTALTDLGFTKVFAIHENHVPVRERVMQIINQMDKKDKVCILTDFDKKGKSMYHLLKQLFTEQGVKLDSTLRGLVLVKGFNHIEQLGEFLGNIEKF